MDRGRPQALDRDDGELVNDGKGAYLTTDKEYGDIELLIEYKTVAKADSGIYLRATPQVQIWDTTKEGGKWDRGADKGSGGLFNNDPRRPGRDPLVLADKPFGEWNIFRIIQVGERVTVYLNDKLVVDCARMENFWDQKLAVKRPLRKTGPIQLQTHGGEIRWRNIFIREIPAEEANAILRKRDADGFVDLFNGKDLTGWAGGKDGYEVKDGMLVNQPKKGREPIHRGGVRRLHRPRRVQAASRRQQRARDPLSGQGAAVEHRDVRESRSWTTTR